jgi:RHS repeat-associated protein
VQKSYTYDVYGKPTATGSLANEYDFAGQETDGTGLQYLRARYMDPETGTFLSRDILSTLPQAPAHGFRYAGGNPVMNTDPTGKFCVGPFCCDRNGLSFGGHEITEGAKAAFKGLEDLGKWTLDQIAQHPMLFVSLLQSGVGVLMGMACASAATGVGVAACLAMISLYSTLAVIKLELIKGEYDRGEISSAEAKCQSIMNAPFPFPFGPIGAGICKSMHMFDQVKSRF